MKVEDHIRRKERADEERLPGRRMRRPFFAMLTYERPGVLEGTVRSFLDATPGAELHVFDDGSASEAKRRELDALEEKGVAVHRMSHGGVGHGWRRTMEFARDCGRDCAVLMEDDLRFSVSWLDVLTRMFVAAGAEAGFVSCFRPQSQTSEVVLMGGVEVFEVPFSTFQVSMVGADLLRGLDLEDAARKTELERTGIDWHVFPQAAKLGRRNWVSVRSYVSHFGHDRSGAAKSGYRYYPCPGVNVVYELASGRLGWEPVPEAMGP